MQITPLSEALGAEISEVNLAEPLDGHIVGEIERLWAEYLVLLFRDQDLDEKQQLAFASRFGELGSRARPRERRPEGADYNSAVMMVSNEKRNGRYIGSLPDGEMWFHHDMCYDPAPSRGTFLYALHLPSSGGNTLFANMYKAYDGLPEATKTRIQGRKALQVYDFAMRERVAIEDDLSRYKHHVQPVTITHPVTGRRALYVNPLITARIEQMPEQESTDLLETLFEFTGKSEIIYEHEWRAGDLLMWDNWSSCHARTDFPPSETRILRRCIIKGQPLHE